MLATLLHVHNYPDLHIFILNFRHSGWVGGLQQHWEYLIYSWDSAGNTCHIAGENCPVGGRGGQLMGDGDSRHMTVKTGGWHMTVTMSGWHIRQRQWTNNATCELLMVPLRIVWATDGVPTVPIQYKEGMFRPAKNQSLTLPIIKGLKILNIQAYLK